MKIGLGTAQFGADYGISNINGLTSKAEVAKIIEVASRNAVHFIDTAALYGDSERVLGETLPSAHQFLIITKTPSFRKSRIAIDDAGRLKATFTQSLAKLRQASVYGLLLHHAGDLKVANGNFLVDTMLKLKEDRLVKKIGVSVYDGDEIDFVINHFPIDLIQLPISIFDQRLVKSGHLLKLKQKGIEIHARSLFLQGLMLMEPDSLPPTLSHMREHLTGFRAALKQSGITAIQAALTYARSLEVDAAIIGINNHNQLIEICAAKSSSAEFAFDHFAVDDISILNPANWNI